ncbi:hypothetical protein OPV22_018445 [Ensete ventricosum]|uniref:Uncharacterized protein n=1 Tax=Ensete ventricosum TaxID=4639 RepID=A0AAV8QVZ3_ENSVE|nr:hypothetical protein OPV22_018445 [Ensete ventricosum]
MYSPVRNSRDTFYLAVEQRGLLEASVALSFLPLPLPSPFSSSPAARAASTVGALVARLPRQGCGHRGNSSPFPAIEDGELAACAALHRSLFLTIEDRSPRVPLMGLPSKGERRGH